MPNAVLSAAIKQLGKGGCRLEIVCSVVVLRGSTGDAESRACGKKLFSL